MKVAVVGAGMLGLTLAHRLGKRGHQVTVLEAAPELGGLACTHDYGPFWWDRFYHVILPQDSHILGLVRELGLADQLRWTKTGTGYHGRGKTYDMNGNADFLRFPLLSFVDKARLAALTVYATRFADPWRLYQVSAAEWLTRICGRRGYEVFWKPLLKAKFGPFHDQIAAVFIWATLTRLFGARSKATQQEKMGYVSGGYRRILGSLDGVLKSQGAVIHLAAPASGARRVADKVELTWKGGAGTFDQVFWTAPTRLLRQIAAPELLPLVERAERDYPTSQAYLGVACLVLALKRPLTPYYVLNIGDERIELTGVIEMTNLIDRQAETKGLSLVYLPRYLASDDPRLDAPEGELAGAMMERGLKRLFPDLRDDEIVYQRIHRTRYVQPLPLVRRESTDPNRFPTFDQPLQILNTSMLTCATLNNNEVVGLVDRFMGTLSSL